MRHRDRVHAELGLQSRGSLLNPTYGVAHDDGAPAGGSRYLDAFIAAGFRRTTAGLRWYASR